MLNLTSLKMVAFYTIFPLLLSGCNFGTKSIKSICKENPELCSDLNVGGWCRNERASLIRQRLDEKKTPSDRNKYYLLRNWQDYEICIEKAAAVQHVVNKERSTPRVEGLLSAVNAIEQLTEEMKESHDPFWLYYRWSEQRDYQAKQKFMALEGKKVLRHPELIWYLATIYADIDADKSFKLMHYSLELHREDDPIPLILLQSLTTAYMHRKDYRNAYIWAKVQEAFHGSKTDMFAINRYQKFSSQELKKMDSEVDDLIDIIEDGEYKSPVK